MKFKRAALTKKQKVSIAILLAACLLIAYGVGVVTDFFASPIFSAFFIFSRETAHTIAACAALAGVAIAVVACVVIFRKRMVSTFKPNSTLPMVAATEELPSLYIEPIQMAVTREAVLKKAIEDEPLPEKKLVAESNPEEKPQANPTAPEKNGKITCQNCKKEFTTPMLMMDFSGKDPKLARYCPYCNSKV